MSDILCKSCFHKDVCCFKEDYRKALQSVKNQSFLVDVEAQCKFFCEGDETERANYIRDLELHLEKADKEMDYLANEIKDLRGDLAAKTIGEAAIKTDRDKLYNELSDLRVENDELYSVNAELKDNVRELEEGVRRLTSQRDTLMKELEAMYERQKNDIQTAMTEDAAKRMSELLKPTGYPIALSGCCCGDPDILKPYRAVTMPNGSAAEVTIKPTIEEAAKNVSEGLKPFVNATRPSKVIEEMFREEAKHDGQGFSDV